MAWLTLASYAPTDPPVVLADVLQAISGDLRTFGGNVDAGGHSLTNCAGIAGPSGASPITISTNGTVRATILGDGKVGIGVSPSNLLTVQGGTSNASSLATSGTVAVVYIQPKSSSGYGLAIGSGPGDLPYIQQTTAAGAVAGDMLLQPYGGKIGIGTTAPTAKLHVTGLDTHASNAAAISAGKTAGAFYTDGSGNVKVVY